MINMDWRAMLERMFGESEWMNRGSFRIVLPFSMSVDDHVWVHYLVHACVLYYTHGREPWYKGFSHIGGHYADYHYTEMMTRAGFPVDRYTVAGNKSYLEISQIMAEPIKQTYEQHVKDCRDQLPVTVPSKFTLFEDIMKNKKEGLSNLGDVFESCVAMLFNREIFRVLHQFLDLVFIVQRGWDIHTREYQRHGEDRIPYPQGQIMALEECYGSVARWRPAGAPAPPKEGFELFEESEEEDPSGNRKVEAGKAKADDQTDAGFMADSAVYTATVAHYQKHRRRKGDHGVGTIVEQKPLTREDGEAFFIHSKGLHVLLGKVSEPIEQLENALSRGVPLMHQQVQFSRKQLAQLKLPEPEADVSTQPVKFVAAAGPGAASSSGDRRVEAGAGSAQPFQGIPAAARDASPPPLKRRVKFTEDVLTPENLDRAERPAAAVPDHDRPGTDTAGRSDNWQARDGARRVEDQSDDENEGMRGPGQQDQPRGESWGQHLERNSREADTKMIPTVRRNVPAKIKAFNSQFAFLKQPWSEMTPKQIADTLDIFHGQSPEMLPEGINTKEVQAAYEERMRTEYPDAPVKEEPKDDEPVAGSARLREMMRAARAKVQKHFQERKEEESKRQRREETARSNPASSSSGQRPAYDADTERELSQLASDAQMRDAYDHGYSKIMPEDFGGSDDDSDQRDEKRPAALQNVNQPRRGYIRYIEDGRLKMEPGWWHKKARSRSRRGRDDRRRR